MYALFQEDRQLASLYMLKRREGWHTTAPKIEKKLISCSHHKWCFKPSDSFIIPFICAIL